MKHTMRLLAVLMSLMLAVTAFASCSEIPGIGDGTGTGTGIGTSGDPATGDTEGDTAEPKPTDVVEIATAEQFLSAAAKINSKTDGYETKTLRLTADIALTGDISPISGFKGTLDGQFHKITGIDVAASGSAVGLFDTLDDATVKNLVIEDAIVANVAPDCAVGILAGAAKNATIEAVTVSGTVTLGGKAVAGGLIGTAEATKIMNVSVTAAVNGAGSAVGGIVGTLSDGATVSAAYASLTGNATASVRGAAVGTKVADSAVAFVLVNEDKIVGEVKGEDYLPDYIIGCEVGDGSAAVGMGWSLVDWDVSGAIPTLKQDTNKTYPTPSVTVDGTAVSAIYGEKLAEGLSKPADVNGVATMGYTVGDEVWYAGLPILGDLALTKLTVDYSTVAGTHTPINGSEKITVGETLLLGDATLTRVWAEKTEVDGATSAVVYYKDENGATYRVSLAACELPEVGEDALTVTLTVLADQSKTYFAAPIDTVLGAWEKDGKVLVLDGTATAVDGKQLYRVLNVTDGTSAWYAPYYTVVDGELTVGAAGIIPSEAAEASISYFDGEWISVDGKKLTVADGKVNGTAFTAKKDSGAYLTWVDADGKTNILRATANGLTLTVGDGDAVSYANNRFSGTYIGVKNGVVTTLQIEGDRVWINGSDTAVSGVLGVNGDIPTFTVTVNGKVCVYTKNGSQLCEADGTVLAAAADAKRFDGTWVLGSERFVMANGSVTFGGAQHALTLVWADGAYSMESGEVVFAFDGGHLTVSGYASNVTNDSAKRTLWTVAEANVFLGGFKGVYVAVNSGVQYAWHTIELTGGVLKIDGAVHAYEIAANSVGSMQVKLCYGTTYSGAPAVATLTPNGDLLTLGNLGMSMGYSAVPAALQDVVGKYYQFLYGTGEEGETVGEISFDASGKLTVNGKSYAYGNYGIELVGGKVVVRFADADGETQTVTFENKTAVWSGDAEHTYVNYDRILPSGNKYVVVGKDTDETLEIIKGNLAHTDTVTDEDDEEEEIFVPASFPLWGMRYTVNGKTYTSTSFNWKRTSDRATLTVMLSDGTDTIYLLVVYDPASDKSSVTLMANGATMTAYSTKLLGALAGEYTDGKEVFEVSESGAFTLNGERVGYLPSFDFEAGVYSFFVNGKTYTVDAARREIAQVDGKVWYDSRIADLAGIKFVAYSTIGENGLLQKKYSLELTPEGLKFAGQLVNWRNYDGFRFSVELEDGRTVTWKPQSNSFESAIYPFCISLYPDATLDAELGESGWANRYFVPELLLDQTGLFAAVLGTGEVKNVFKIMAPVVSGNSFLGFTFTVDSNEYAHYDYSFRMVNGVLNVILGDDNVITLTETESGVALGINGYAATTYVMPDMSGFVIDNQFAFGGTNEKLDYIKVELDEDGNAIWYYAFGQGEYTQKSGTNFGFGQWNGETVVFIQVNSYKSFVLVKQDSEVFVINQEVFHLVLNPLTTPDGKTLTFAFAVVTDEDGKKSLTLTGEIDGTAITAIEQRDANYNFGGDNHAYIKYTYGETDYAVALNCDEATAKMNPAVVLTLDQMNTCYHESLTVGSVYFAPVYDAETKAGKVGMQIKNYRDIIEADSFTQTADSTVWKLVYTADGKTYTDYVKFFSGAADEKGMKVIKGDFYPILGDHTVGDETVTVTFETDEDGVPQYWLTVGGTKYLAKSAYSKTELSAEVGADTYILTATDGEVSVAWVETAKLAFVGEHKLVGSYYDKAVVAFENGAFTVTFLNKPATDVTFAADGSYLAFTAEDGTAYRICLNPDTSAYYKSAVVSAATATFLGTHGDGKLVIELSFGYSSSVSVKYDGKAVANVQYHSDSLMSFEVGDKVHVAEVTADGIVVTLNVLDLSAEENAALNTYKGSYTTDKSNKIVIGYSVSGTVGSYTASFFVTLDGKAAALAVDAAKVGIVNITCEGVTKHYAFYSSGSNKAFVEVSDDLYASLGSTTIGEHTLTVSVSVSYNSRNDKYSLSTAYLVNGEKASATAKTFGELKLTQLQQSSGERKYFYYYVNGDTTLLQEMTAEEIAVANLTAKTVTVDDVKYTFRGNVTLSESSFTVGYVFGSGDDLEAVTLTAVDGVDGASSFTANGKTFYYLTFGSSYTYLVMAADYAVYGEKTYGDVTLKFTWGTQQLMVAVKGADGEFGDAVKLENLNDGAKDYKKFTADGKIYILATDKDGNEVLTDATSIGGDLKHFKNFTYSSYSKPKVFDLNGSTVFSSFEAMYKIGEDGKPLFVFKLDDTLVTEYVELEGGEVLKMKVGETYRFFAIATNYAPSSSWYYENYQMIEVTEAQAAIIGKSATVDGAVYTVLGKGSSWKSEILVYVGTADKPDANSVSATLAEDGSLTFTYGGKNYKATVTDGVLTVTEVTA